MNFPSKRHFFGATRFFRIDNRHYQGVFVSDLQRKQDVTTPGSRPQQDWRCWRCLDRWCLDVRHSLNSCMNFPSNRHFFGSARFFRIDNGVIMVGLFLNYSQNNTLQDLNLTLNNIGDAGAASLGDALAYVQSRHPKILGFDFIHFVCKLARCPIFSD
jgi:hypothetical protein